MKKLFINFAMLLAAGSTFAQVTVQEPEFINSYCILTSDSTLAILPKESGSIQKHENKAKKWTKIIGGAADVVGAVGMVGAYTSGSLSGAVTGIRAAGTAASVGHAADAVGGLTGAAGMDIVFNGKSSAYTVTRDGKDARLLIICCAANYVGFQPKLPMCVDFLHFQHNINFVHKGSEKH